MAFEIIGSRSVLRLESHFLKITTSWLPFLRDNVFICGFWLVEYHFFTERFSPQMVTWQHESMKNVEGSLKMRKTWYALLMCMIPEKQKNTTFSALPLPLSVNF